MYSDYYISVYQTQTTQKEYASVANKALRKGFHFHAYEQGSRTQLFFVKLLTPALDGQTSQ
jgi:hypothetical protein